MPLQDPKNGTGAMKPNKPAKEEPKKAKEEPNMAKKEPKKAKKEPNMAKKEPNMAKEEPKKAKKEPKKADKETNKDTMVSCNRKQHNSKIRFAVGRRSAQAGNVGSRGAEEALPP